MHTTLHLVLGGVGALMLAGGAGAMFLEGQSYLSGPTTAAQRILALDSTPVPLSSEVQRDNLTDCFDSLRDTISFEYIELTPEQQAQLPQRCLERADAITASSPSYSLAWYVGALSAATQSNWDGMNLRLLQSQQTGRYEQWIGEMRVDLAETYLPHLSQDTAIAHERDLRMLVQTSQGIRAIADRYVNDATFRERITAIVETLPGEDQQRFLRTLQRRVR